MANGGLVFNRQEDEQEFTWNSGGDSRTLALSAGTVVSTVNDGHWGRAASLVTSAFAC